MKVTASNPQFMVLDEFLDAEAFEALWRWFQVAPFFNNDLRGLHGSWRLDDGRVMRGPDIYYGAFASQMVSAKRGSFAYPTGSAIDLLVAQFLAHSATLEPLVGTETKDWRTLAVAPRLYERNSSLYWHRDSPSVVTGSCTFYCHPEWNIQWGGELFIAHESARSIPDDHGPSMIAPKEVLGRGLVQISGHLDNREVNQALIDPGLGHYVMPKPNRLVVLQTGHPHMINKVQPAAGDHVRASVTLFLIRAGQEGVERY